MERLFTIVLIPFISPIDNNRIMALNDAMRIEGAQATWCSFETGNAARQAANEMATDLALEKGCKCIIARV